MTQELMRRFEAEHGTCSDPVRRRFLHVDHDRAPRFGEFPTKNEHRLSHGISFSTGSGLSYAILVVTFYGS